MVKKNALIILCLSFLLASCNGNEQEDYLSLGFTIGGPANVSPLIGIKARKEQQCASSVFEVSLGCDYKFKETFLNYKDTPNAKNGQFVSNITVYNDRIVPIWKDDKTIDNFPNDNKYQVSSKTVEGTQDLAIINYKFSYEYTIDFTKFGISSGLITFCFGYYDTDEGSFVKEIVVNEGGELNVANALDRQYLSFSIEDDTITFGFYNGSYIDI